MENPELAVESWPKENNMPISIRVQDEEFLAFAIRLQ